MAIYIRYLKDDVFIIVLLTPRRMVSRKSREIL